MCGPGFGFGNTSPRCHERLHCASFVRHVGGTDQQRCTHHERGMFTRLSCEHVACPSAISGLLSPASCVGTGSPPHHLHVLAGGNDRCGGQMVSDACCDGGRAIDSTLLKGTPFSLRGWLLGSEWDVASRKKAMGCGKLQEQRHSRPCLPFLQLGFSQVGLSHTCARQQSQLTNTLMRSGERLPWCPLDGQTRRSK